MSFTSIVAQEIRAEVEGLIELVSREGEASHTQKKKREKNFSLLCPIRDSNPCFGLERATS